MLKELPMVAIRHAENKRRLVPLDLVVQRSKNSHGVGVGFPEPGRARILRFQDGQNLFAGSRDDGAAIAHGCQLRLDLLVVLG
jgi:hypothetical protein